MNYFAYGANVNKRGMARRCPAARAIGLATLDGYKLCFRHFADLMPSPGNHVTGALWTLTPACLRALDQYEGSDYKQITIDVLHDGQRVAAMAYVMAQAKPVAPPRMDYYKEVAAGYRDFGIDESQLRRARYDTLRLAAATTESLPPSPSPSASLQGRPRRALWDPAEQGSGTVESLSGPRLRPKPE